MSGCARSDRDPALPGQGRPELHRRRQLRIKNRAGKVVKVVDVGSKATNTLVSKRIKVDLKRGRYTVKVLARDLAGNQQRKAVASVLTVR